MKPLLIIFGSVFVSFLITVIVFLLLQRKGYTGLGAYAYPGIIVGAGPGLVVSIIMVLSTVTFMHTICSSQKTAKLRHLISMIVVIIGLLSTSPLSFIR